MSGIDVTCPNSCGITLTDGSLTTATGRLEIGQSQVALYQKYLHQGMDLNELVVLGIGPELPTMIQVDELLDS